jgi:MoaA/NifB/PqqE/SkfB family radical SAM enzyme
VRAICTRHPENEFIVGVSIDGPGEMHDAIRGVPGNFEKCLDTLAALQGMQLEFPKLRTSVLVTLMKKNIDAVPAMLREFADTARVDFLTVEVLRDQTPVEGLEAPPIAKLAEVHGLALELNRGLLAARQPDLMPAMISSLEELYRTQRVVRMTGLLDLDCQAGAATAVLEANGTVRLCELLESVGNVKEHGYDFGAVWSGDAARAQRAHILTRACSCTHCVNVGQSIPFDRTAENRRLARQRALEAAAV